MTWAQIIGRAVALRKGVWLPCAGHAQMKKIKPVKDAQPVVTKSVRQTILERLKTLDEDKKTAISWHKFKRQLLSRQRKPSAIVDELR